MKIILPSDRNCHLISKFTNYGTNYAVMIIPITERQEKAFDNLNGITIGHNHYIEPKNVYCYGEIDFYNDDDIEGIRSFDWISGMKGIIIPAYYDFDTHTCEDINNQIGHHETFDNAKIAMYAFACIGKPDLCVIFKCKEDDIRTISNRT